MKYKYIIEILAKSIRNKTLKLLVSNYPNIFYNILSSIIFRLAHNLTMIFLYINICVCLYTSIQHSLFSLLNKFCISKSFPL